MESMEALERSSLYKGLSNEDLKYLLTIHRKKNFASGEYVIVESMFHKEIHLLTSGKLMVLKSVTQKDSNLIAEICPGECVGEFAILNENHRGKASVKCAEDSSTLRILVDQLLYFCDANHSAGYKIFKNLSEILASRLLK
jgi:CRP-like cAMP-binding protein